MCGVVTVGSIGNLCLAFHVLVTELCDSSLNQVALGWDNRMVGRSELWEMLSQVASGMKVCLIEF